MKLNVKAFALTCGILWGAGIFLFTWWVMLFEGTGNDRGMLGKMYRGYRISPLGSLIGLIWGFVDGLAWGALLAWMYNTVSCRMAEPEEKEEERHHHHHRPIPNHAPWLYAMMHRIPHIHV
jgi:hypothetical protein